MTKEKNKLVIKKVGEDNELAIVFANLKMRQYIGIGNICPYCNHRGDFGSIVKFMTDAGNWWLLCGWCGKASYVEKQDVSGEGRKA
jgi:hypothetical protein